MKCEEIRNKLNDLVDDALDGASRPEVEGHLDGCDTCREEFEEMRSLAAQVAALPRDLSPPRDLWPGTVERLRRRGPGPADVHGAAPGFYGWTGLRLAAAAVLLVAVSAGLTALIVRGLPTGPTVSGPSNQTEVRVGSALPELRDAEREFIRAADNLVAALERRQADLPPRTMAIVEENLELINQAIDQTRAALGRDPSNLRLGRILNAVYRKKVDLLKTATGLPAPV